MNKFLLTSLQSLKQASYELALSTTVRRNHFLQVLAENLIKNIPSILQSNEKDLKKMDPLSPMRDRLLLTEKRIQSMAEDLTTIISLPDPLHQTLEERTVPSGIHVKKVTVPLGVMAVIYESRPNVTIDVASLCIKSGNAVLLRGGSEAYESNKILVKIIQEALEKAGLPKTSVLLLKPDRKFLAEMLTADEWLDLIIPRGGASLIKMVRQQTTIPVIETGASVVHTFVDESADIEMACNIIFNEKTRRPSVCNAVDTVLIHKKIAENFFPALAKKMMPSKTFLHTNEQSYLLLKKHYPPSLLKADAKKYFKTEFLSLQMNVVLVDSLDRALAHIRTYSLKHSESIVTRSEKNAKRFKAEVDAACVYVNTSTAFSDGAQFGLGAEIGISTQKLHARGPMGLRELTSYKWLVSSKGSIRI